MKRIAVLSDIHGNLAALEAVAADIQARAVDAVFNLGDSLSGPLMPRETAQYLMRQNWTTIAGNHERQLLNLTPGSGRADLYTHAQLAPTDMHWLASLPGTLTIDGEILLCHGTPHSDTTALLEQGDRAATRAEIGQRLGGAVPAVVLCGHTHVARSVRHETTLIVNPGSVGHPAYADDYPFPHAIESGTPDARYAILEKRGSAWTASLITVPYDFRPMAALARLRGFPEWESALLTGYVT